MTEKSGLVGAEGNRAGGQGHPPGQICAFVCVSVFRGCEGAIIGLRIEGGGEQENVGEFRGHGAEVSRFLGADGVEHKLGQEGTGELTSSPGLSTGILE